MKQLKFMVTEITGQFTPPAGLTCPPGQSPAMSNGKWSCAEPLVETHPVVAVLLVLGFFVIFFVVLAAGVFQKMIGGPVVLG